MKKKKVSIIGSSENIGQVTWSYIGNLIVQRVMIPYKTQFSGPTGPKFLLTGKAEGQILAQKSPINRKPNTADSFPVPDTGVFVRVRGDKEEERIYIRVGGQAGRVLPVNLNPDTPVSGTGDFGFT